MLEWYLSMTSFEQVLYAVAILSTGLFILKGIFLFFGVTGISDGLDVDDASEAAGVRYFSIIGMLSFLAVGAWGAILAFAFSGSHLVSLLAGVVAGAAEMFATIRFIRFLHGMQENGNLQLSLAIGKVGEVYLTIPPMELGEGKVNIMLNGALRECQAVSLDKSSIPTGAQIRVIDIQGDNILVVQRESDVFA